ncbi:MULTISPECIES: dihydroneopterin aldolase [unclassified Synechococcus]|jgi:dihydroneopterin aldolase|uniref:dihydroneopterin aldolase n=1 Tax=unclassified Synechococcus TaxID=2626047 RepID=UPI0000695447|nr:dihydroneopterin aldolase [Synechococcus sp. JA-2-3B'a(2-13)]ABD03840.1 dihydroneopterin aldolase [Synechococcus sp. JA-2-3B'a(2-13)]
MTQGRLVLQGLVFHAYHGHCPEEAVLGGRFVVDVEMRLSLAEIQDDLSRTVDYAQVYERVRQEVTGQRRRLIETLADQIAERLWQSYPQLEALTVRVHKPHAPLPGLFEDVYVEVDRRRAVSRAEAS